MEKKPTTKFLPSLKENRRYLVLLVKNESREKVKEVINDAILKFIGVLGYAHANPSIVEIGRKSESHSYIILGINRKYLEQVKASFALAGINCIGVSGTINKVRRFL